MGRALNRLSARAVATATSPGYYADGGGLYLQVTPSGTKTWIFRYRFGAKRPEMGLGPLHSVSLAAARAAAAAARKQLVEGVNPMQARRAITAARAGIPTFGDAATTYIDSRRPQWRNEKHGDQWANTIATHAAKLLLVPVDQIDTPDVLAVLEPIWGQIPETASRVRGRIETVLDAATVKGHRSGPNPARWKGHLAHLLPARTKAQRGNFAALAYSEMPAFMKQLRNQAGSAARLLEWQILNASRPTEARLAVRAEIKGTEWVIPAARMKAGTKHIVPLSARCTTMLATLPKSGLLFRNEVTGEALSEAAVLALLKRMGFANYTAHGFRSSFKDWASESTEFPGEVSEMALAHTIDNKTEAAYRRGALIDKRRELMQAWADYLDGMPAPSRLSKD